MTTTVSLKQGETRTSGGPIPHPLKSLSTGIIYINDLPTNEGEFSVEGTLGDNITYNAYIKLFGIIHAIPRTWKNQITSKYINC